MVVLYLDKDTSPILPTSWIFFFWIVLFLLFDPNIKACVLALDYISFHISSIILHIFLWPSTNSSRTLLKSFWLFSKGSKHISILDTIPLLILGPHCHNQWVHYPIKTPHNSNCQYSLLHKNLTWITNYHNVVKHWMNYLYKKNMGFLLYFDLIFLYIYLIMFIFISFTFILDFYLCWNSSKLHFLNLIKSISWSFTYM